MSQVIHCVLIKVLIKDSIVKAKKSFMDFTKLEGKTAEAVVELTVTKFHEDGLDTQNCYGQGYDNAVKMAGIH